MPSNSTSREFEDRVRLIKRLRDAKRSHRRWVSDAQILMEGVPVKNDQLPLNDTECGFGKWYYTDGQALHHYRVFRELEPHHQKLHTLYLQIFHLLFRERKRSLFDRLLGRKADPTEAEVAQAKELIAQLNVESLRIMELLDELERIVIAMSDQEFEQLFGV